MYAMIAEKDGRTFSSVVFAVSEEDKCARYLVFDDEKEAFRLIPLFYKGGMERQVFILSCDKTDFVSIPEIKIGIFWKLRNVDGFDWIIKNQSIFASVLKNKPQNPDFIDKARKINSNQKIEFPISVENLQDVQNLLLAAFDFHDAQIKNVRPDEQADALTAVFDNCWGAKIWMRFATDVQTNLSASKNATNGSAFANSDILEDGNVFFKDGFFYFVNDCGINDPAQFSAPGSIYFRGRTLQWTLRPTAGRYPALDEF